MNATLITFAQLCPGDRFTLQDDDRLFTKLSDTTAREHSTHSINLKEEGFGYQEDSVQTITAETNVNYVPVDGPLRVSG
ncbi:hypothetical protein IQ22_01829 [Pseudomonas duriflava]|uniref:Uncharacterized protein n=1 Tax=Pseudomonas duriflava TaxID=459528 RepID=A0A562QDV8_9PSED|nr:hypothetical protein [Pseudomonas duriflava]TWI54924.1 hypothetical protein IQ22_01829 [Pseudomonas duriflava]